MVDERTLSSFANLLEQTTGLSNPQTNRSHLKRVIAREAQSRSTTPGELLRTCAGSRQTLQAIINATMIGETYFFREVAQFRYLREVVAPELFERDTLVTAWSASCSSGEEAISLAVLLHDTARGRSTVGKHDPPTRVYATDIRSDVPERIKSGIYPLSALRRDGAEYHELFRSRYVSLTDERTLTVSPGVVDLIEPGTLNLFSDPLDRVPDDLDVVFFRNTLIYAPAGNREVIVRRIVEKIRPGGYLFLANSEIPFVSHSQLQLMEGDGVYCLRKCTPGPTARLPRSVPLRSTPPVGRTPSPRAPAIPDSTPWSITDVVSAIADGQQTTSTDLSEVAQLVKSLFVDLDEERFDRVDDYLKRLSQTGVHEAVIHYCTAWAEYARGSAAALCAFGNAIAADDSIWPAYFYRARLNAEQDPESARADLLACIRIMDQQSSCSYGFLVGGFDSKQIRALCVRWIERIDAEKVESSYGS